TITVDPAGSEPAFTEPRRNARVVRRSIGISVLVVLCTVGALDVADQLTTTVFSLSVNVTELFVDVRDHPSGIEILKPPTCERYGTNCVVSGMSPGGLL